jgi:hypothetical protein
MSTSSPSSSSYAVSSADLTEALRLLRVGDRGQRYEAAQLIQRAAHLARGGLPRPAVESVLEWVLLKGPRTAARTRTPLVRALSRSELSPEQVHALMHFVLEHMPRSYAPITEMVDGASATPELFDFAAEHFGKSASTRSALALRPEAMARPVVRAALSNTGVDHILAALALSAPPEEFRVWLLRLMRKVDIRGRRWRAYILHKALEEASREQLGALYHDDLLPLLSSAEEADRLAAIRAVGVGLMPGEGPPIPVERRGAKA